MKEIRESEAKNMLCPFLSKVIVDKGSAFVKGKLIEINCVTKRCIAWKQDDGQFGYCLRLNQ